MQMQLLLTIGFGSCANWLWLLNHVLSSVVFEQVMSISTLRFDSGGGGSAPAPPTNFKNISQATQRHATHRLPLIVMPF